MDMFTRRKSNDYYVARDYPGSTETNIGDSIVRCRPGLAAHGLRARGPARSAE